MNILQIDTTNTLEISSIIIGLLGGLAIFLFGMEQMTGALKQVAGGRMKNILAQLTTNRFKAVFAGAFVTAIIQSSSVTTVLVVGFVSVGLMTLPQSIGIIMGAEIGTTVTAQLIAFKVTKYALILVAIGFALQFLGKRKRIKQYGITIMGFGLIFFGMNLMSEATNPLRSYQPFIDLMQQMDNPLLGILVSALFTGLIQSSSASIGIVIVLASQGFISLEAGIALVFGANIGTSITALLASIGKPREAIQTALIHILFNTMGVIMWVGFIDYLAAFSRWLSPVAADLSGTAKLAAETPRQIANAHTIFNTTNTFVFIWFTNYMATIVRRLVPEKPKTKETLIQPKYLDSLLLSTPELALERSHLEIGRLGKYTLKMMDDALPTVFNGSYEDLSNLEAMDDNVDILYDAIILYLRSLSREGLLTAQSELLSDYMAIANHIESIGDMIQTNLVETGGERLKYQVEISPETQAILKELNTKVYWAVEQSLIALVTFNKKPAKTVSRAKGKINQLVIAAEEHLSNRLLVEEANRLATFRVETEIIEYLKRIYYFAKRIARIIIEMPLGEIREQAQEDWTNLDIETI